MKSIRFSLDMSPELNQKLEDLAEKSHASKSDVLRRAIMLLEVAVEAKEKGKKIGIASKEQTLETEIVGL
jgi:predicted transcriptional regulator